VTVGIDANIVIYAGLVPKKKPKHSLTAAEAAAQAVLTRRAKILLHELRSERVIFPMIAVSEVLVPVPATQRGFLITTLKEIFVCAEFADRAASIAADIWALYKDIPADRQYDDRIALSADVKIVATAKALGATSFYTNDEDCRTIASLVMKGKGLPKNSQDLFIDQILAEGAEDMPKSDPKRSKSARGRKKGV